jgi:GTPase SAR1 family protein
MASVLVGNKMDLEEYREVENQEAKAAANKLGIRYMEISAKTSMRCQI